MQIGGVCVCVCVCVSSRCCRPGTVQDDLQWWGAGGRGQLLLHPPLQLLPRYLQLLLQRRRAPAAPVAPPHVGHDVPHGFQEDVVTLVLQGQKRPLLVTGACSPLLPLSLAHRRRRPLLVLPQLLLGLLLAQRLLQLGQRHALLVDGAPVEVDVCRLARYLVVEERDAASLQVALGGAEPAGTSVWSLELHAGRVGGGGGGGGEGGRGGPTVQVGAVQSPPLLLLQDLLHPLQVTLEPLQLEAELPSVLQPLGLLQGVALILVPDRLQFCPQPLELPAGVLLGPHRRPLVGRHQEPEGEADPWGSSSSLLLDQVQLLGLLHSQA
ncbi:uncharacterized protein LOC142900219 isoform X2 [Nelusetta ayraudi]|uniref:uncharacterized protein LOC142900219 isoform X2 n=1 Tax=Nelusetta ayraudi TaxID=303726 RepID=UPI003F6FF24D